ncbi:hypothetical protein BO70DRAFT_27459 [Aspergillus heteromorphus CBS 117.55]|uniref:Uncharacterized protein n=1 Tax=Aspergillus heteromorphus CBS 117.55 TaxID=1448321 RepID=A0A317WDZ0_9EURO|nr:uncharacterized protein BO70DRAFT_27459 [Aspergillus heteromorphus CBS 117.55]PWY83517.1 hypothetical protein BO70DRAFT_27459 [Aspergillus heteromorphus CBS 117.55]
MFLLVCFLLPVAFHLFQSFDTLSIAHTLHNRLLLLCTLFYICLSLIIECTYVICNLVSSIYIDHV